MLPATPLLLWLAASLPAGDAPFHRAELVFPPHPKHNPAPGTVGSPTAALLVPWRRGAGERSAADVAVYGARRRKGAAQRTLVFLSPFLPVTKSVITSSASTKNQ